MPFSPDLREGVAAGPVTVSFRPWWRPQVRVAVRYHAGPISEDTLVYRVAFHPVADEMTC